MNTICPDRAKTEYAEWCPSWLSSGAGSYFICYINDMPDQVASFIYMYGTRMTQSYRRVINDTDSASLQHDLEQVTQ